MKSRPWHIPYRLRRGPPVILATLVAQQQLLLLQIVGPAHLGEYVTLLLLCVARRAPYRSVRVVE